MKIQTASASTRTRKTPTAHEASIVRYRYPVKMRVYNDGQLERYLKHIGFEPPNAPQLRVLAQSDVVSETTLTRLQRLHMARVPYDSTAVHYSTDPKTKVSLDPQWLFQKIVVQGRGGVWFELNTFFAAVMLSLDFEVYSTGARLAQRALGPTEPVREAHWFVVIALGPN